MATYIVAKAIKNSRRDPMLLVPRRCPDEILILWDNEETKAEGQTRAERWLVEQLGDMVVGDWIEVPHKETGEIVQLQKLGHGMMN